MLGNHVDVSMTSKIIKGEYIDLAKLLPKDKVVMAEEPQKMELVSKEGHMFWMPSTEQTKITNYNRWE